MNDFRSEFNEAQKGFYWTLPRAMLAIFATIVAIFLLLVVTTPLTIGFGWFSGEANLRSFGHVRQTYAEAFDDSQALDALARQACRTDALVKSTTDQGVRVQYESQLLAYSNRYDSLKGEYDAYMRDHFRGGVIRPKQLPLPYPTLSIREKQVC